MYSEIGGISIRKHLGSDLANMFVGFAKAFFFNKATSPMFLITVVILFPFTIPMNRLRPSHLKLFPPPLYCFYYGRGIGFVFAILGGVV